MWFERKTQYFIKFDLHEKWEDRKNTFYKALDLISGSDDVGYSDMIFLFETKEILEKNINILYEADIILFSIGEY